MIVEAQNLECRIGKISLRNPSMLASGILGETAESMYRAFSDGAGAVVTKSIGADSRDGYENPTVYVSDVGMINAMGLPNPGIGAFADTVRSLVSRNVCVVGSLFGSSDIEFTDLARMMEAAGAIAIELNLSCPHAKGVGSEIGSTPEAVSSIVGAVSDAVDIPVWAKLTPNVANIGDLAEAAESSGADAIVCINTVKGMVISAELRRPVLSNIYGGLSGRAIKPVGLRCVFEVYERCSIPVIGVGGIYTGTDAAEYIMAGASAFQIGTAVSEFGTDIFRRVVSELTDFMARENFVNIGEMVGIAHRNP
jgi:dihydroorotate dehydrogenase (NAD+) catalytic subunit